VNDGFEAASLTTVSTFFEWLWFIPHPKLDQLKIARKVISDIQSEIIEEHKKTFNPENIRDFIDAFLASNQKIDEDEFNQVMVDMIAAGADSTAVSSQWAFYYLAKHPEVQTKAREELISVVGTNSKEVTWEQLDLLPYLTNIQREAFRVKPTAPFGLPHECAENTVVNGFFFPEKAWILFNCYGICHDPKIWGEDVSEFRPERYDSDKISPEVQKMIDEWIVFGVGRRKCIGKELAVKELKMFIAMVVLSFNISVDPELKVEDQVDVVLRPKGGMKLTFTPTQDSGAATLKGE